ncbi:MAG: TIGR02300 family protein [Methyloceanibacter sp.]
MSKPARGTKRVCPSCGARFYDLNRTPITCPVCQAAYQLPTAPSRRSSERAQAAAAPRKVEEAEKRPAMESADVISLEEVEEAGAEAAIADDEEMVDLGDDAPEIPPGDDENAFLEEEEEGEADVSGIVSGDKGEES